MQFHACVFLLTNSLGTNRTADNASQIVEEINQILPSQAPLLKLKKYRENPDIIVSESMCEVNIILSKIHKSPCQRIMKNQYNSARNNCQVLQNSFWSMSEVGAICTDPYIFVYFKQNLKQNHIKSIGINLLNLLNLNPIEGENNSLPLNSHSWAFYDESCHEHLTNLSLKIILSLPKFYRYNNCLKYKTIVNSQLVRIDLVAVIIISILGAFNFALSLKIIKNIYKLWLNKDISRSSTYIHMQDL